MHDTKLQSILSYWCNFHVDSIEVRLVKSCFDIPSMVQKRNCIETT